MTTLPIKYHFRAWWEGYDLDELRRILSRRASTDLAAETAEARVPSDAVSSKTVRRSAALTEPQTSEGWTSQRLVAAQIVWGENSLSPRGDAQLKALAAKAALGPRSRVLHLGAELGGTAAILEHGIGCKVLAAETLNTLVAASAGRVVQVDPQDAAKLAAVDLVLVDGIAERAEPLATILRNQSATLAPGGMLVLRSLVMNDERAAGSMRFRDWAAAEPVRPRLRSAEEIARIMQEAWLTVAASTSTADEYADEVEHAWGAALDRIRTLHRDPTGRVLIPTLLAECERWLKRIELLREGIIGVRQVIATRRDRGRR